jgi:WbqC-like protein family
MIHQRYHSSPHWPGLRDAIEPTLDLFAVTDRTAVIAEASTRAMLHMLDWRGEIIHSRPLAAGPGRTQRLADLAATTRARSYLCGTGGMRYLDTDLFRDSGIHVTPFHPPTDGVWATAREISALWHLTAMGPENLQAQLRVIAQTYRRTKTVQPLAGK